VLSFYFHFNSFSFSDRFLRNRSRTIAPDPMHINSLSSPNGRFDTLKEVLKRRRGICRVSTQRTCQVGVRESVPRDELRPVKLCLTSPRGHSVDHNGASASSCLQTWKGGCGIVALYARESWRLHGWARNLTALFRAEEQTFHRSCQPKRMRQAIQSTRIQQTGALPILPTHKWCGFPLGTLIEMMRAQTPELIRGISEFK